MKILLKGRLRRIYSLAGGYFSHPDIPSLSIYPIGWSCNHECLMCWRNDALDKKQDGYFKDVRYDLTIDNYKKILLDVPISWREVIICGGGEPFLYPHMKELLVMIRNLRFSATVFTNGVLIDDGMIENVLNTRVFNIYLSINAASRKVYKIVNGVDDYQKVLRNIKDLIRARQERNKFEKSYVRLILSFVIQRENYKEIIGLIRLAKSLGVDGVNFSNLFSTNLSSFLNLNEVIEVKKMLREVSNHGGISNNADDVLRAYERVYVFDNEGKAHLDPVRLGSGCELVNKGLTIDSRGYARLCCVLTSRKSDLNFGNCRSYSVSQIWNEKKYLLLRRKIQSGGYLQFCKKYCVYYFK